ncbi:hypothetical protein, partial [Xanthomonas maliensis]|uniref:hypothetical protein n=1 Tax=Xanthomonas maliensis TaxID=1321368 RepID=UPI0004CF4423
MFVPMRMYRRVQQRLPAGIRTVGVLPATASDWEASPLAALSLPGARRVGRVGLRLHPCTHQRICTEGLGFLQQAQVTRAPVAIADQARCLRQERWRYRPWQRLGPNRYWSPAVDLRCVAVLDAAQATVWLVWW